MHGDGLTHRRVAKLEPLRQNAERDVVQAGAAVAHRQTDAQKAEFRHFGQQLMRVGVVAVVLFDDGDDFLAREVIDHLFDHFVFVTQLEVHFVTFDRVVY